MKLPRARPKHALLLLVVLLTELFGGVTARSGRCAPTIPHVADSKPHYQRKRNVGRCLCAVGDVDAEIAKRYLSFRAGGKGRSVVAETTTMHQKWTVLLVAMALFNDTLQLTMLVPIIHTLVHSPPPLGVASRETAALGLFLRSRIWVSWRLHRWGTR
jgi:hypothetical protein